MVNGLINQFTTVVTTRPLRFSSYADDRPEVDLDHHREDHRPDEDRHRDRDARRTRSGQRVGDAGDHLAEGHADHDRRPTQSVRNRPKTPRAAAVLGSTAVPMVATASTSGPSLVAMVPVCRIHVTNHDGPRMSRANRRVPRRTRSTSASACACSVDRPQLLSDHGHVDSATDVAGTRPASARRCVEE